LRNMKIKTKTLNPELLRKIDAYWRAANYLSVGQIYLYDNLLLKKPLKLAHIKPRLLGHWGTTPGQNFVYGFTRIAGRLSGPTASGRNRHL
jgi:xylulose-5-phosphate/fructose-6-phosphate phosphoketolase